MARRLKELREYLAIQPFEGVAGFAVIAFGMLFVWGYAITCEANQTDTWIFLFVLAVALIAKGHMLDKDARK